MLRLVVRPPVRPGQWAGPTCVWVWSLLVWCRNLYEILPRTDAKTGMIGVSPFDRHIGTCRPDVIQTEKVPLLRIYIVPEWPDMNKLICEWIKENDSNDTGWV